MKAEHYHVGWICALPCELAAAICMLDELHEGLPQPALDDNNYTLGSIGLHNIAIACLPSGAIGTVSATRVAERMRATFLSLRFVLMVGIGGGVPSSANDIRLGDVVVSKPGESPGGVIQYDFGKTVQEGRFVQTGFLSKPPDVLLKAVSSLQAQHMYRPSRMREYLSKSAEQYPLRRQACNYVGEAADQLFDHKYDHPNGELVCDKCSPDQVLVRPRRNEPSNPVVHYGLIASGNQVMRDGTVREQLRKQFNVLCFEMEAAGLMDTFPCLIIRGICDYADSHKNKTWQDYAAAAAAAYAKELLYLIPFQELSSNTITGDAIAKDAGDPIHTRFPPSESSSSFQGLGLSLGPAPEIDEALFIGRSTEIEEMEKLLLADYHSPSRHVLILGGIGGVGKTQLSLAFAKQNSARFTSVFWLNATTETSLKSSFTQLSNLIQPLDKPRQTDSTQDLEFVSNWLSQRGNDQWLLIFDNHDDPEQYDIHEYYPMASHGSIIITTRCPEAIQGRKLRVGPMAQEVLGIAILETRSGRKGLAQDVAARQLVQRLGGLPLALATAGSFFKQHPISFSEYLQRYETTWRIIGRPPRGLPEYQGRTLYTTWDMSFCQVQRQYQEAADLLKFLGYLDHQQIWYGLLLAGRGETSPPWFQKVTADKFAFAEAMGILVDLCLVEVHHETGTYSMHVCVHDWVMAELNPMVEDTQYALALDCIARAIGYPTGDFDFSSWHYGCFVPHAVQLAHERFQELAIQEITMDERSPKLNLIAQLLDEQGLSKIAERMLTTLMTAQHTQLGFDHSFTLETTYNLGVVYDRQGKYTESQGMLTRAVDRMELTVGPDHPETLLVLDMLGTSYLRQGKSVQAEKVYTKALHLREQHQAFCSSKTLWTMRGLAASYAAQGKDLEAQELFTRILNAYNKRLKAVGFESEGGIWALTGYIRTSWECSRLLNVTGNQFRLPIAEVLSLLQRHTNEYDREALSSASCSLFYWLGRCFLAAGDVTNAQITFQQKFGARHDRPSRQVLAQCDGCQRMINADSGFNVCQQCPEFDLCDACLALYKSSQLTTGDCVDHPFFRVDIENTLRLSEDEWVQWLQRVIQVYSTTQRSADAN